MTSSSTTPPEKALTEEVIEGELRELNSKIRFLDLAATIAALGGLSLGALIAIPFGPLSFLVASIVGGVVALVTRAYTLSRKTHLREEIVTLQETGKISTDETVELTTRVNVIYTDKAEEVSRQ